MKISPFTKTTFEITKMDCPSEEALIRLKLESMTEIQLLEFDIPNRNLTIFHKGGLAEIESHIYDLKLGGMKIHSEEIHNLSQVGQTDQKQQRTLLWAVLGINFSFFILEMSTGLISKSMGLVADSLDMLADSFVYGLSLMAVGSTVLMKKRVARLAGYFQILLAIIGFSEIIRRFFAFEGMPDFRFMIGISFLALLANSASLFILQKSKSQEAHMQASMIFTSNDIIINLGVILAGGLVFWLQSPSPDLIIGALVFILVIRGALRILKLGK